MRIWLFLQVKVFPLFSPAMKLDLQQLDRVASLFRAFAESTRLAIIQELKSGELSVSEIVARLSTSQANTSKQLKILHEVGI